MIEIEKNVPIPIRHRYPFAQLEIGDSFFISDGNPTNINSSRTQFVRTTEIGKGRQFTCRKVEGGVRVWRIK